ncbi:hypothetical protein [Marinoscillum furvescens]|nr:hypothetical protein [Marinoscillum furvescens]
MNATTFRLNATIIPVNAETFRLNAGIVRLNAAISHIIHCSQNIT